MSLRSRLFNLGRRYTNLIPPIEIVNALETNYEVGSRLYVSSYTPTVGTEISFRSDWFGEINGYYFTNQQFSGNGGFNLKQDSNSLSKLRFYVYDGSTKSALFQMPTYGDKLTMRYSADGWRVLVNDVEVVFIATTVFTPLTKPLVFGNAFSTGAISSPQQLKLWDFNLDGQTWDLSEGSGTTAVGSLGTVLNVNAYGGDLSQMWTTSERFNTLGKVKLQLRPNNGEPGFSSNLERYELGNYYRSRISLLPATANKRVDVFGYTGNNGISVAPRQDDMPPFEIDGAYVGGYHSWNAWECNVPGFNKTAADAYSVWQLNGGSHQIIIVNIRATTYVQYTNVDQSSGAPPPLGTYDHVSGAVNTASFTITNNTERLVNCVNRISKKMYVDEVEVPIANQYQVVSDKIRFEEIYDVPEKQSWVDYMISNLQGGGAFVIDYPAPNQLFRVTNNFIYDGGAMLTGKVTFDLLMDTTQFDHTMFIHQTYIVPKNTTSYFYVPKSKEFTDGDGTFNFSNLTLADMPSWGIQKDFTASTYEFINSPPDRVMQVLPDDGLTYVQGFLPVLDAAIGVRKDNVNLALNINNTTGKMYMRGQTADKVGASLLAGTTFEVVYYRGALNNTTDRTSSYFVTDYETGKGYMYADWHDLPKVDAIPVPPKYQGRAYTVLEKTSNVTLADGTLGSTLPVTIANTHNYGFVTIEIAV